MTLREFFKSGFEVNCRINIDFRNQEEFHEVHHTIEGIYIDNKPRFRRLLAKYGKRTIIEVDGFDDGLTILLEGAK